MLEVGQRVKHFKYGEGTIIAIMENECYDDEHEENEVYHTYTIEFDEENEELHDGDIDGFYDTLIDGSDLGGKDCHCFWCDEGEFEIIE